MFGCRAFRRCLGPKCLQARPLAASIEDMLKGYRQRHPGDDFEFGLEPHHGTISMEREMEVLDARHKEARQAL